MKVLALVAVTLVSQALGGFLFEDEWQKFKATFNKNYEEAEEILRKEVFMKNLEKIQNHDSSVVGYTLGVNEFADLSSEEFLGTMTGLKSGPMDLSGADMNPPMEMKELPKSFDWRNKGAVTPVKNQDPCESCWAFSTTGALEGAYQIKHNKLVSFSEQELMDCDKNDGGCKRGGWMATAFNYVKQNGIQSEDDYPYLARDDTCHLEASKVITKLNSYVYINGSAERLQQAVFKQPVSVALFASESIHLYNRKVIKDPDCKNHPVNHGVLIVGWDTSEYGEPYWIVKNSWGDSWGDGGYFKVLRGENVCSIESYGVYPVL